MSKCFHPRKKQRQEHRQRREQWLWGSRDPGEVSFVSSTDTGGGIATLRSRQDTGTALSGTQCPVEHHLRCPAPSTSAAPHASFPASSLTKAAHCCSGLCQPDVSSSKRDRRSGESSKGNCSRTPWEALLGRILPPAVPPVTVDA